MQIVQLARPDCATAVPYRAARLGELGEWVAVEHDSQQAFADTPPSKPPARAHPSCAACAAITPRRPSFLGAQTIFFSQLVLRSRARRHVHVPHPPCSRLARAGPAAAEIGHDAPMHTPPPGHREDNAYLYIKLPAARHVRVRTAGGETGSMDICNVRHTLCGP